MRFIIGTILVLFSVYTGWVAWQFGYTSVFEVAFREHPTIQAIVDLFITCGLLLLIMITDNQKSGRTLPTVVPFAIVTVLFGAIGPLLYFLVYPYLLKFKDEKKFNY